MKSYAHTKTDFYIQYVLYIWVEKLNSINGSETRFEKRRSVYFVIQSDKREQGRPHTHNRNRMTKKMRFILEYNKKEKNIECKGKNGVFECFGGRYSLFSDFTPNFYSIGPYKIRDIYIDILFTRFRRAFK